MTVREIIDRLRSLPPDTPAFVHGSGMSEGTPVPILEVLVTEIAECGGSGEFTYCPDDYDPDEVRRFPAVVFD